MTFVRSDNSSCDALVTDSTDLEPAYDYAVSMFPLGTVAQVR